MRRELALLLALSTVLAGCFGEGETIAKEENVGSSIWETYEIIDVSRPVFFFA